MKRLPFDKPRAGARRSLGSLKGLAWKAFSEWVRKREANVDGYARCVTCGKWAHWKDLHASHFLPGRGASILFVEENCHAACEDCNVWRGGARKEYELFMLSRYGQEKIDELKRLRHTVFRPTREYYEALIEKYTRGILG